jgi:hypothetical protein
VSAAIVSISRRKAFDRRQSPREITAAGSAEVVELGEASA